MKSSFKDFRAEWMLVVEKDIEDALREAVSMYASPILNISDILSKEKISNKLKLMCIVKHEVNLKHSEKLIVFLQRGVIISRILFIKEISVYVSHLPHPFLKKRFEDVFCEMVDFFKLELSEK